MNGRKTEAKFREWLRRYVAAELIGTVIALCFAYVSFAHSHSYVIAAAAGFIGEGIGFYGYFVAQELHTNGKTYRALPLFKRFASVISKSSTNLVIEFAPAELVDNILVRPFLMYFLPQHVKPYAFGFIVGKLTSDVLFYLFAISGYEIKKRINAKA